VTFDDDVGTTADADGFRNVAAEISRTRARIVVLVVAGERLG
jgi:hypothetical protein